MPKNSRTILTPTLGLDIGRPGTLIDARAMTRCRNIEVRRQLVRKSRGGAAMGADLGERILGYAELERDNIKYLVRVGPTKAQMWSGSAWVNIHNVPLTGDDQSTLSFAFPEIGGSKVMAYSNYEDAIRKYTGTGLDAPLGGSPPRAKHMLNYFGYLLLGNVVDGDAYRSRIQWPDVGEPEVWDAGDADSQDLLEDDLEITAMGIFSDFAAVHKEKSIYLGYLTGTDQVFRFDRKETGAGAVAPFLVNLPTGEQLFLSREGLRLFNGSTAPPVVGSINEELADSMTVQFLSRAWGILVRELNEVWIGIPIGGREDPDTIYKYNYLTRTIFKDAVADEISIAGLFTKTADDSIDSDSESIDSDPSDIDSTTILALHKRVLWGYGSAGRSVERTDSANFDGSAIDSQGETKDFTAADFEVDDPEGALLEWQGVEVIARGLALTIEYSTNEGENWTTIRTLTLGSAYPPDSSPTIAYFRAVASKCRFRFSNNDLGGSFEIKQFRPMVALREDRAA